MFLRSRLSAVALLIFFSILHFVPYFSNEILPIHDASERFQFFHYFYSETLSEREFPLWIPYGVAGIKSAFHQLFHIGPADYIVGLLGVAFGAENTLDLFKASMLIYVFIYLGGIYLFISHFSQSRWPAPIAVAGAAGTLSWFVQPYFNLFAFYTLPYVLLFAMRWAREGRAGYLLFAALIELCSLIGNVAYIAPMHALIISLAMLPVIFQHPQSLRSIATVQLFKMPILWLDVAVATFVVLAGFRSIDNVVNLLAGRDPVSYTAPLGTFLEYGRLSPATTIFGFLTGAIPNGPNTYYIGLLPLGVIAWVIFTRCLPREFWGLMLVVFTLSLISVGGIGARIAYHFPGMEFYRHIGLVFGMVDTLLLLAFGLALDGLICSQAQGRYSWHKWCVVGGAIGLVLADAAYAWHADDLDIQIEHPSIQPIGVLLRLAAYAVAIGVVSIKASGQGISPRRVILILAIAYLIDVGVFRWDVAAELPHSSSVDHLLLTARPLPWRASRSDIPPDERAERLWAAISRPTVMRNAIYEPPLYAFSGWDPCAPRVRTHIIMADVKKALEAMGGSPDEGADSSFFPSRPEARAALGCESRKVWLAPAFQWADNEISEAKFIKDSTSLVDRPILFAPTRGEYPPAGDLDRDGSIEVLSFSPNFLTFHIGTPTAKGRLLVYADAYAPEWSATIDGKDVPIFKANGGFKAVFIPVGADTVQLHYGSIKTRAIAWGLAIMSAIFCVVCLGIVFFASRPPFYLEESASWQRRRMVLGIGWVGGLS